MILLLSLYTETQIFLVRMFVLYVELAVTLTTVLEILGFACLIAQK